MGSFLLWLYFSLFSLAWFLVGFIAREYVSIYMKPLDVGITHLLIPADIPEDGMVITVDSNSLCLHGNELVVWGFPQTPAFVSKSIGHS